MGYEAIEAAHGLPTGIIAAVIAQESGGDPCAARYEPAFFERYIRPIAVVDCPLGVSDATERNHRATSWGLMQIMGQVARERGYAGKLTQIIRDPEIGVEYGARHLAAKLATWKDLGDALSAYNSGVPTPSNRNSYVQPILERMTL